MYGCGEQEVGVASGSGWNLWVWLLGVVVRRYIHVYRFPHTTYLVYICSFLQQHPTFCSLKKKVFRYIYHLKVTIICRYIFCGFGIL